MERTNKMPVGWIALVMLTGFCSIMFCAQMEWLAEETEHGEAALMVMALAFTAVVIWLGRRRLIFAIPLALVFLFLASIRIPGAIPARQAAQRAACVQNLKAIRDAKIQWAERNNKSDGAIPMEDDLFGKNGILENRPTCPRGGVYTIGALNQNPTCSLAAKKHALDTP